MISENKTEWVIICDLDEFMYAREGYDTIRQFLEERGSEFNQLLVQSSLQPLTVTSIHFRTVNELPSFISATAITC